MTNDYHGWTNYATWNVVLWIDNEEPSYKRKLGWLKQFRGKLDARVAEEIAEDCLGGQTTPDMQSETVEGRRWRDVDWKQIAKNWSDEASELVDGA